MKIIMNLKSFSKIKEAKIELGDFTLFVGDNNSGKTYIMQLLYGILDFVSRYHYQTTQFDYFNKEDIIVITPDLLIKLNEYFNQIINENIEKIILATFNHNVPLDKIWFDFVDENDNIEILNLQTVTKNDPRIPEKLLNTSFTSNDETFSLISITKNGQTQYSSMSFNNIKNKSMLLNLLFNYLFASLGPRSIIFFPSSRAGLQLLYKDYFISNVDEKFTNQFDFHENIDNHSSLTTPVYNYLRFLQAYQTDTVTIQKNKELINFFEQNLIDGKLIASNDVVYIPRNQNTTIPLYLTSAMISELTPFYYYISSRNFYSNNYLIIDEVEASLHPKKQFELIRFINHLNNRGKKIIMSTHSDSMASKINNLVMLSKKKKN